jgi:hypothetical protein
MHIIPFKGQNRSSYDNLNLLFKNGKTFIMDNHLAASWCWLQIIDPNKQYNLFHIDRHYDLLNSLTDWWVEALEKQNINLSKISIEDLLNIKFTRKDMPSEEPFQLFRWDNYITIFNRLYPNVITSSCFATHKDGDKIEEIKMSEPELYDLPDNLAYWINSTKETKWIINLDIDYFFYDSDEKYYQILTDEYVFKIADEIKQAWNNIEVLTIALSPEMCGSWEKSIRVAKIITDHLNLEWIE